MKEYSINPFNQKKYLIPSNVSDKKNIDSFLLINKNKKIICVQGLGFVGAVMSLVCANSKNNEYAVVGIDLPNKDNFWKITSLNEGQFPIESSDDKVYEYYNKAQKKKSFYATYDPYIYSLADIIIVDINLDVQKKSNEIGDLLNFDVSLNNFKKGINSIAERCKEDVLLLVETTVPPGTCKKVIYPLFSRVFKKRKISIKKLKLGHSYERVMPGPGYLDSIINFYRVFSGIDTKSEIEIEKFLKTIISTKNFPLTKLKSTTSSEMAKVLENSYRALNISFIVEWSRFAEESEVDLYEVINAIKLRPTHNNMMFPGIGVGGYCLTKDPLLASWSKLNLFDSDQNLELSEKAVKINDKMPKFSFDFFKKHETHKKNQSILFLGVSYRGDVGDTRYSPVDLYYDFFIKEGYKITLHDPFIKYWEEKKEIVITDLNKVFCKKYDIVCLNTLHSIYKNNNDLINYIKESKDILIYDNVGVLSENEISEINENNKIKILGRGDL